MKPGRPSEHRRKLICYVKPATKTAINGRVNKADRARNTIGKVVDTMAERLPVKRKPIAKDKL